MGKKGAMHTALPVPPDQLLQCIYTNVERVHVLHLNLLIPQILGRDLAGVAIAVHGQKDDIYDWSL